MKTKVSDFKIAESILKGLCKSKGINFIDIDVEFKEHTTNGIYIQKTPENIAHTLYLVVSKYIEMSKNILGKTLLDKKEEKQYYLTLSNILRGYIYDDNSFSDFLEEMSIGYLYQRPLIWIMMKDIICPVFKTKLKNIKLVIGVNPYIDIARFYKEGSINSENMNNYEFIFVNEIGNHAIQNAFLFIETLKAHNLEPISILKDIFESDLYEKFYGLVQLFLNDDTKVSEFISLLSTITGINLYDFVSKKSSSVLNVKTAQQASSHPETAMQWWYLGLAESMLEPTRGYDWSTHSIDKRYEDFWDKVEDIKKQKIAKRKEPGITFNELLRLKDLDISECKVDPTITLQGLLSSKRVW
jgi:hypothetical protein